MVLALYIDDKEQMIKAIPKYAQWFKDTFHHTLCGDLLGRRVNPQGLVACYIKANYRSQIKFGKDENHEQWQLTLTQSALPTHSANVSDGS